MSHYDESLRGKLGATNGGTGIVLNKDFAEWEKLIEENIVIKDGHDQYTAEELRLLGECRRHADAKSPGIKSANVLAFVHPLYMHISDMDDVYGGKKVEAAEYLENFMKLLKADIPKDKAGKVLIDTAHHYAAATSRLLEEGYIDDVIFTEYCSGTIKEKDRAKEKLSGKSIIFGGVYNNWCLTDAIEEICDLTGNKKVKAIRELCLDYPGYGRSIRTSFVWTQIGKNVDMISMYELGKYIGVEITPWPLGKGEMAATY
jgi:hypothetical protein